MSSPNRKYTQLTVDDVRRLWRYIPKIDEVLFAAGLELLHKASRTPDAKICLAHAVVRSQRIDRSKPRNT